MNSLIKTLKKLNEVVKTCEIIEGIGTKSGNPYMAVQIELSNGYKELVFLTRAMAEMIKLLRAE